MIEKIVCSLELSKKLKEIGIKQESIFYYYHSVQADKYRIYTKEQCININGEDYLTDSMSAFTAQELIEILRFKAFINMSPYLFVALNVYYQPETGTDNSYTFQGDNLADLLAKVLIARINEGEYEFK